LLLNDASAQFKLLVPRTVEIEHTRHVKNYVPNELVSTATCQ